MVTATNTEKTTLFVPPIGSLASLLISMVSSITAITSGYVLEMIDRSVSSPVDLLGFVGDWLRGSEYYFMGTWRTARCP